MMGPKVIKQTENYRVIERTGRPGEYLLQYKAGIWRAYKEYKRPGAAIRKMDELEQSSRK